MVIDIYGVPRFYGIGQIHKLQLFVLFSNYLLFLLKQLCIVIYPSLYKNYSIQHAKTSKRNKNEYMSILHLVLEVKRGR